MASFKERSSLALPGSASGRRDLVLLTLAFVFLGWLTATAHAQPLDTPSPHALIGPLYLLK
jgi:hypothetical protein